MKLEEWREEIDRIDGEIVALLGRRAKVARKIGVLKAAAGLPVADTAREEKVLRGIGAKSSAALPGQSLNRIYQCILQESRLIQAEAIAAVEKNSVEV